MTSTHNVLMLAKDDSERFVFLFATEDVGKIIEQFGRLAADPGLSFTWYDAALLSMKARRLSSLSATDRGC